jgi:hypothetical protein
MQALRTAMALALGLSMLAAIATELAPPPESLGRILIAAVDRAEQPRTEQAEVAIAFDQHGRPVVHALQRSSGSTRADAAAVKAALELASLRHPGELAGRTVMFRTRLDEAPQLD